MAKRTRLELDIALNDPEDAKMIKVSTPQNSGDSESLIISPVAVKKPLDLSLGCFDQEKQPFWVEIKIPIKDVNSATEFKNWIHFAKMYANMLDTPLIGRGVIHLMVRRDSHVHIFLVSYRLLWTPKQIKEQRADYIRYLGLIIKIDAKQLQYPMNEQKDWVHFDPPTDPSWYIDGFTDDSRSSKYSPKLQNHLYYFSFTHNQRPSVSDQHAFIARWINTWNSCIPSKIE